MGNKQGISLIVLVITIIVMIILAGAIILTLSNTGIIGRASYAIDVTNLNQIKEVANLLWADAYAEGIREESRLAIEVVNGLNEIEGLNVNDYIVTVTTSGVTVEKPNYVYYSTLIGAVNDINNGIIGENDDATKITAVAGACINNGTPYVVLLKDTIEDTRVQPNVDMTINLGGHTLSANDRIVVDILSCNVTIDGRLDGSSIYHTKEMGVGIYAIQNQGEATICGGTYKVENKNQDYDLMVINNSGVLTVDSADLQVHAIENGNVRGISNNIGFSLSISNSNILSVTDNGVSVAVYNLKESATVATNCNIKAYSNYFYDNDKGDYTESSRGIRNLGKATLNNCYVIGTHSGISNKGTIYVNGGTYEGFGHGGIYFGGNGTTSYVRNATIKECEMPSGYAQTAGTNNVGFYIGGSATDNYINVYMDNCTIYGSSHPIVLRGSDGEQYNKLYISNSTINLDKKIRIDNNTHELWLGKGNNFTEEHTTLPSAVYDGNDTVYTK